ncbi:hypothetical protein [Burkholderia stagnalis]|uniref:hypothetical protein n=1 Tax=Burkholderia stagnalis TaxID=1503054 RepID=UPI000F5C1586|nr:hypothetical protein [Burkholderia stagnalis]RQP94954.1 hypothetical protein DF164_34650 [Burkholderia stagnalis]RQY31848.1 hypothetical protein DF113_32625 [Burkholderia stagnalis]RQY71675.1 hypothetical protein DF110_10440 [Burkholderia stagnalis]
MSVSRRFTRAQWKAFGRRLDALPEKPKDEQSVKVGDGVKSIRKQISAAREKGYTLPELIEQAAQDGIGVSLNSLRYAMRRADGKGRTRHGGREAERCQPVPGPNTKSSQSSMTSIDSKRPRSQANSVREATQPRQGVQGFLGFPISPDSEDL